LILRRRGRDLNPRDPGGSRARLLEGFKARALPGCPLRLGYPGITLLKGTHLYPLPQASSL
jgi:hypothetical protein